MKKKIGKNVHIETLYSSFTLAQVQFYVKTKTYLKTYRLFYYIIKVFIFLLGSMRFSCFISIFSSGYFFVVSSAIYYYLCRLQHIFLYYIEISSDDCTKIIIKAFFSDKRPNVQATERVREKEKKNEPICIANGK